MNAEENHIYELLKAYKENFLSVAEISKHLGHRRCYGSDRNWARPILRRMELDGHLESNAFGEYRITKRESDTTFKEALSNASLSVELGDTTIISLKSVRSKL